MSRRQKREPSRLKMKNKSSGPFPANTSANQSHHGKDEKPDHPLNVNFEFENYTYDAYHVLRLPGGSSWQAVQEAYQQSLMGPGEYPRECIQKAFEALKKALDSSH